MRAVLLQPPEHFLEERRKLGADVRDEVWDGVLHMPPQPSPFHQELGARLIATLMPISDRRGLVVAYETASYQHSMNYRVPDVMVYDRKYVTDKGVVGPAELVIEILSPDDESRDKFPFYAALGVKEIWLVDPKPRAIEVYTLRGATYFAVVPDRVGLTRAPVLGLELSTVEGPRLRIRWDDGAAEI